MAELLKHQFGTSIVHTIAQMLLAVEPEFPATSFLKDALNGYEQLELMSRARQIANALHNHLPADYGQALTLLMASTKQPHSHHAQLGMTSFLFLPHIFFIRDFGLDYFEASMQAQYILTQKFTAEFSIRPFLERYPTETLARLHEWAHDPNHHVRRLVSEGTRPRLPWASRLRQFQLRPQPVLQLLELLKDDPEIYVRRSVANNLNDIGKDHPEMLFATAQRWLQGASKERQWLVEHALRTAVKRSEPGALTVLGFGNLAKVAITKVAITPLKPTIGSSVVIAFVLVSTASTQQRMLVDFQIHYVKSNGFSNAKVFKLKTVEILGWEKLLLSKKVSLSNMTTRKHYAGVHRVDVVVNGRVFQLGSFTLMFG